MLGLLVSSELVVQLLSEARACLSEELEEGEVQLGAFDADTGSRKQVLVRDTQGNLPKAMLGQCTRGSGNTNSNTNSNTVIS